MIALLIGFQVLICIILICIILIQSGGKGATMGVAMGAGQQMFGGSGGKTFFTRATGILAGVFMLNCLAIALLQQHYKPVSALSEKLKAASAPPPGAPPMAMGTAAAGGVAPITVGTPAVSAPQGMQIHATFSIQPAAKPPVESPKKP